nr:MAG TPA: hypothetical protein [Caudoviricetes sp.]
MYNSYILFFLEGCCSLFMYTIITQSSFINYGHIPTEKEPLRLFLIFSVQS